MKLSQSLPVAALAAALLVGACSEARNPAAPGPAFSTTSAPAITYSGRATVVQAALAGLEPITFADAGPLSPEGGSDDASLVDASVPGLLTVEVLHASTVAEGNHSRSEASVASLSLTAGGNTISAGFLMAQAEARCTGGGAATTRNSGIPGVSLHNENLAGRRERDQTHPLLDWPEGVKEQPPRP